MNTISVPSFCKIEERHNVPSNFRIEKCSKNPESRSLWVFHGFFVIFLSFAISLNFHHFMQTISEKFNIFRNNVIMAKPEKVLRYFDANHLEQSLWPVNQKHSLSFTGPIWALYWVWKFGIMFSHMSRLQIPKCKLKVTLLKYHTSLIKKKLSQAIILLMWVERCSKAKKNLWLMRVFW